MNIQSKKIFLLSSGLALLAGCSSDSNPLSSGNFFSSGTNLTTSSVSAPAPTANSQLQMAAPKIDPSCSAISFRIDQLRKEGFVENLEKVSTGKSSLVTIKRDTLAKMAELQKANAEFQTKCSALGTVAMNTPAIQPAKPVAVAGAPTAASPIVPKQ
ncbi:MAG: hypothetical protein ACKOW3_06425 [Hyphomicrobium sp.]